MTSLLRRGLFVLLSIFALVFAGGYLLIFYVESIWLEDTLIPELTTKLESEYGIKLELTKIELSLFQGVLLKDLHLQGEVNELVADFRSDEIRIRYRLSSLLSKRLVLSEVSLHSPRLSLEGRLPETRKTAKSIPIDLHQVLSQTVDQLPFEVEIAELSMTNLDWSVDLQYADFQIRKRLHPIEIDSRLLLGKSKVGLALHSNLPNTLENFAKIWSGQKHVFETIPSWNIQNEVFLIRSHRNQWKLQEVSLENQINLGSVETLTSQPPLKVQLALHSTSPSGARAETNIQIPQALRLDAELKLNLERDFWELANDFLRQDAEMSARLDSKATITFLENIEIPFNFADGEFLAKLEARVSNQSGVTIKTLSIDNSTGSIGVSGAGNISKDLNNIAIAGEAFIQPSIKSQTLRATGEARLPWRITRSTENRFRLQGALKASDLSLISDQGVEIHSLTADVPFDFDLVWKNKALFFESLEDLGPFERVDYGAISPYVLDPVTNFRATKVKLGPWSLGPIYADLSLRQNLITAEQYQLDAFGGRINGRIFLNLNQGARRMGVLIRASSLDPKMISGQMAGAQKPKRRISFRAAQIFDFDQSLLEGRIDVTEIGGSQMTELINLVDPEFKNDQMNLGRRVLKIAYPRYVGLRMNQGAIDMTFDMGGILSIDDLGINGVPLAPILLEAKEDLMKRISKGGS